MTEQLTQEQIELLANEMRQILQARTCCPLHAGEVLMRVMVAFVLDDAHDDPARAARALERATARLAKRVRRGDFVVVRGVQ
jgi:hypothetical protein